jgi:hypothetical protein
MMRSHSLHWCYVRLTAGKVFKPCGDVTAARKAAALSLNFASPGSGSAVQCLGAMRSIKKLASEKGAKIDEKSESRR